MIIRLATRVSSWTVGVAKEGEKCPDGASPPQFHLLYGDGADGLKVGHHHEIEDSSHCHSLQSRSYPAVFGSEFLCRESKRLRPTDSVLVIKDRTVPEFDPCM